MGHPDAAKLWTPEDIIARLESITHSSDERVSLAAHVVLGRGEAPVYGDPQCRVHGRNANRDREHEN